MMKNIVMFIGACIISTASFSQSDWCGTSEADKIKRALCSEEELIKRQELETAINQRVHDRLSNHNQNFKRASNSKIIPVVVHIIHDNGTGDIDDTKVHEVLRTLNEDYKRLNPDTNETRDLFKPYAGSMSFEFRLAKIDPFGNPTTGIVRKSSSLTYDARDNVKSVSYWDSQRYFNIWVVNSIQNSGGGGTVLGYAQFPTGGWGGGVDETYGLVIRSDEMKYGNRTITHEVGHCFNLYHTFEGSCGGSCEWSGDEVCDTPPSYEDTYSCSIDQNSCTNDRSGTGSPFTSDVVDQIENYMSYDDCQNMFTLGQVARMEETINTVDGLINLTSDDNLLAAGVSGLTSADFYVNRRIVCMGEYVTMIDNSQYAENVDWTISNDYYSENASGDYSNIKMKYSGLYDISMDASSGATNLTSSKTDQVFVLDIVGSSLPFSEGFENMTNFLSNSWFPRNYDKDNVAWEITSDAAYSGSNSIKLNNFNNTSGNIDAFYSNSIDLSPLKSANITMKIAFAQIGSSTDKVEMWAYKNCGMDSMPMSGFLSGASLAGTNTAQNDAFTPTDNSQWKSASFTILNSTYLAEDFMFKLKFIGAGGNNIFIDDINITGIYKDYPVLQSPDNGSPATPDNVLLDWKAVKGVDQYEYQLDTTDQFNSVVLQTATQNYISEDPYGTDTQLETSNLIWGQTYYWRVRAITASNPSVWSSTWSFKVGLNGVGINEVKNEVKMAVFPNPVTQDASLSVMMNKNAKVNVTILNLLGQPVRDVEQHMLSNGSNVVSLSTSALSKGIYFVQLNDGTETYISKFVKE